MRIMTRCLLSCWMVGALSTVAHGVELSLKPVDTSGPHWYVGDELVLDLAGGGQIVTLEIRVDGWSDPDQGLCDGGEESNVTFLNRQADAPEPESRILRPQSGAYLTTSGLSRRLGHVQDHVC